MINLNVMITRLLNAVQTCSSSPVIQWMMRILALSHAISSAGWPPNYRLKDGQMFDFIVVGSGSAGAIVAARLSEIPHYNVLLVEAGGDPPLASVVPSLFTTLTGTEYDWAYDLMVDNNIAQAHTGSISLIRGKVLGGSSSINYEVYVRGEPRDFDEWSKIAPGWDWESVLPYFKKLENMTDPEVFSNPRNSYLHATDGPVKISRPIPNPYFRQINENIIRSYEELGVKRIIEVNGPDNLGITRPHFTFADGRRSSTAESYLRHLEYRTNLYVAKYTRATKLLINPYTMRTYGVKLLTRSGQLIKVYAKNEVILSAGSIDSPKLLMLSGVGPKEELQKHNIDLIKDLPVGENLQDHQFVPAIIAGERGLQSSLQHVLSATELASVPAPLQNAFINFNRLDGRRQLQFFNAHVGAFVSPVIQITCEILSFRREFCASIAKLNLFRALDWTIVLLLHPLSRGRVTLRSSNPLEDPYIDSGFLSHEKDIDDLLLGVHFVKALTNTTYYRSVDASLERLDVKGCKHLRSSGEYWRCYVKNTISSLQHPVGTCAMGADGVVDERLKVHGISGLRVVDASVMPLIPGGNTNAATMMIGEKAADIIKEEYSNFNYIY